MNIKKEDFKKLQQLDRIEYLLMKDEIQRFNKSSFPSPYPLMFLIAFQTILMVVWYGAFRDLEGLKFETSVFGFLMSIMITLYIIGVGIHIITYLKRTKEEEELRQEYFKIEAKK